MIWIIGIIIYLLIGVGVLIYAVNSDPWCLYFWWLIVLFYPVLIIRSLFVR